MATVNNENLGFNSNTIKKPTLMGIDITYNCNLRCRHCFNCSGEQDLEINEMSDESIITLAEQIAEFMPSVICICGGEPLLRKELLYKVIKVISKITNGYTQINMVTNGILMDVETAKKLKECGLIGVQVSLDGSSEKTYEWLRRSKGSFDKAIEAIKILIENGLQVFVSCTPTKININDYENVIKLCESLGVKQFRVQPLMLLGRATENLKDYVPNNIDYFKIRKILNEYSVKSKMQIEWGDPIEHLTRCVNETSPQNYGIHVDAYGYIEVSPYLPIRVGHIARATLKEYWDNGFKDVWSAKFIKEMSDLIKDSNNMELNDIDSRIPRNYKDKPIYIDLLEYDNFNELTLEDIINLNKY